MPVDVPESLSSSDVGVIPPGLKHTGATRRAMRFRRCLNLARFAKYSAAQTNSEKEHQ